MTGKRIFLSFEDAVKYVHQLKISNKKEWFEWVKAGLKPKEIPSNPFSVYSVNWISWGHWLGTGLVSNRHRKFRAFEHAREFAQTMDLKNLQEWREWAKTNSRPSDIPSIPNEVYKNNGWISWADFLGVKNQVKYRSFEDARDYVQSLNVKSREEWFEIKKKLKIQDIPSSPATIYTNEWKGWSNFLRNTTSFRSYDSAKAFVNSLKLETLKNWHIWAKSSERPIDIPLKPDRVYKDNGWISWVDWLGIKKIGHSSFLSFIEARNFAHSLKLNNVNEWVKWAKTNSRPKNIPASPVNTYRKNGWKSWGDFLGTNNISPHKRSFKPFEEARIYARSLGLKNEVEWNSWIKTTSHPDDIPASPRIAYKNNGWTSFKDFLGLN